MLPKIKTILYCTQMGPNASYVFRHAVSLARDLGARIVALHVVEKLKPDQEALVEGYVGKGTLHDVVANEEHEAVERLRRRIQVFCERELGASGCEGLVSRIVVAEGAKVDQVLRHVESEGADLVVMGAHAELSLFDSLIGTTAQKVVQRCPVPVLTVQVPEGMQDADIARI